MWLLRLLALPIVQLLCLLVWLLSVGDKSKIIFCGDYRQTDLRKKDDKSGISKFLDIAGNMKEFSRFEFGIEDIVRSSLVKNYIIAKTHYEVGHHG